MPGKGRPFVSGDSRQHPGPGRTRLEFLDSIRVLSPEAVKELKKALKSKSPLIRFRAMQEIFDRGWGRPKQIQEITGEEGSPVQFVFHDKDFKVG